MADETLKNEMISHLILCEKAHFKNQQLGEPDLTADEKHSIAEDLLARSPVLFLSKFGEHLDDSHFDYFLNCGDEMVDAYINKLLGDRKKPVTKNQVRNRRLEALRRLKDEGEYFSDVEMKRRNPLMYEELVGQYLTEEEKKKLDLIENPESFSEFFMQLVETGCSKDQLKREVECDLKSMSGDSMDAIPVTSSVALWGETYQSTASTQKVLDNSRPLEVSEHQKGLLLNEFRSHVYSNFLIGKDADFDYSEVDNNADYDDLNMIESDQQDNYFDSESPKTVIDDDSNS